MSAWARWRYRGEHRSGGWTVAALVSACRAQQAARRESHRRALRRPFEPMTYLGQRLVGVRLYVPGDPGDPEKITGTLTIANDDATGPIVFAPRPTMPTVAAMRRIHEEHRACSTTD